MLCGIDEAGRGSLCGSMFIAGCACDDINAQWMLSIGVKDSKKLAKSSRFKLADRLKECDGVYIHIVEKTATEIDALGLSACLKSAIEEIIQNLLPFGRDFCMDGNTLFGLQSTSDYSLKALIKGDQKVPQIAAASILAKVSKDNQMSQLDTLYPQYDFKNNAGYGTKNHLEAIKTYGQTQWHRKSFSLSGLDSFGRLF